MLTKELSCERLTKLLQVDSQTQLSGQINAFADPFLASQALQGLDATQATINPYAEQAPSVGAQAFFKTLQASDTL